MRDSEPPQGEGSSPLARGLRAPSGVWGGRSGIIPARAGFTTRETNRPPRAPDHPRSRGVYGGAARGRCLGPGSSPLARGLHLRPARPLRHGGIIPARAGFTCRPRRGRLGGGDHPRSRGVYCDHETKMAAVPGSSPLARGLRRGVACPRRGWGIVPARAGFTHPSCQDPSPRRDHPRSRGVYRGATPPAQLLQGSSPLARGLPVADQPCGVPAGIIPARAGFTCAWCSMLASRGDHPRSRGVYSMTTALYPWPPGSSPLARGLLKVDLHFSRSFGIIPARAGFTSTVSARRAPPRDHPRSRGVYQHDAQRECWPCGSSPLARGLLADQLALPVTLGIIPARAGFTITQKSVTVPSPDHPRSRGVYAFSMDLRLVTHGSSPLARGLPNGYQCRQRTRRIIPARAGFTRSNRHLGIPLADHPRSRGVYSMSRPVYRATGGSSPLARGLPGLQRLDEVEVRIIPARAGFTTQLASSEISLPDHPRSRGVYAFHSFRSAPWPGSSPLARGLPPRSCVPALGTVDHPRSRGVYFQRNCAPD